MATRYFKSIDGYHNICSMSSGNRSKEIPGMPDKSYLWVEIDRKEFLRLKRMVLNKKSYPIDEKKWHGKMGVMANLQKERTIPEDLEHIGMGLPCAECGDATSWLPCWNCGGEGGWDGEELMEEDPLWYGPDDYRFCDECRGKGGHPYCLSCRKIVKVVKEEDGG